MPTEPEGFVPSVRLEKLGRHHLEPLIEMAREFAAEGDDRYAPLLADPEGWLDWAERCETGIGLEPGLVPQSMFVLVEETAVVGGARLRVRLSEALHRDGGHVGYEIRPSARGRGLAKRLLVLILEPARALGLSRVLLTTAEHNTPSRRVVEACGGRPDGRRVSHHTGDTMLRYWIDLGERAHPGVGSA